MPLAEIKGDEIWQVSLAKLREDDKKFVQVPLSQITWYHQQYLLWKDSKADEYKCVSKRQHCAYHQYL